MAVACALSCPLARNALEAVVPHHPGVDALVMIIGGAVLQSGAGMYLLFFKKCILLFYLQAHICILKVLKKQCYACHTLQVFL